MEEKVKSLGKHLEIVSQINLKMESLQTKTEELDKWRNMEKSVPGGLLAMKAYDISYTLWTLMSVKRWLLNLKKWLGKVS